MKIYCKIKNLIEKYKLQMIIKVIFSQITKIKGKKNY